MLFPNILINPIISNLQISVTSHFSTLKLRDRNLLFFKEGHLDYKKLFSSPILYFVLLGYNDLITSSSSTATRPNRECVVHY